MLLIHLAGTRRSGVNAIYTDGIFGISFYFITNVLELKNKLRYIKSNLSYNCLWSMLILLVVLPLVVVVVGSFSRLLTTLVT